MASMRVHELAKEFGMSSKELLDRLEQMKIPAKNHASTLVDAYVDKIRKVLGPELAERAAAVEAAAAAKAAEVKKEEQVEREVEEAARKAADEAEHARREVERRERGDFDVEKPVSTTPLTAQAQPDLDAAESSPVASPVKPTVAIETPKAPAATPVPPVAQPAVAQAPRTSIPESTSSAQSAGVAPSTPSVPHEAQVQPVPAMTAEVKRTSPQADHEQEKVSEAVQTAKAEALHVQNPASVSASKTAPSRPAQTPSVSRAPQGNQPTAQHQHHSVKPQASQVSGPEGTSSATGQQVHPVAGMPANRTARPSATTASAQNRQTQGQRTDSARPGSSVAQGRTINATPAKQKPTPVRIPAPGSGTSRFDSLLSQIEAERNRLENVAAQKAAAKAAAAKSSANTDRKRRDGNAGPATPAAQNASSTISTVSSSGVTAAIGAKGKKEIVEDDRKVTKHPKKLHGKDEIITTDIAFSEEEETEGEGDRYTKMAKEAERFQRNKVIADAKAAVEAASSEGEGRRRRRKEKRVAEKAAAEEQKVEQAILRGEAPIDTGATMIPTGSTVAEFSELIGVPSNDIIKRLFLLGTPLTLTQTISDDLIELIGDDLGLKIKVSAPEEQQQLVFYDDPKDLVPRSPVVTVMGHVDHGKTSLLDAIRSTDVVKSEAGGITQRIGASVVHINGRKITFIDTPGHEAFTAMRARGAKITDVVVLVVAADDGVMPQTIEAIHHAEAAGVPIVVAVNKIDKPGADPSRVRQELTTYGIVAEEWGGQNMFVDVSAKKHIGIDDLLETIILQADVLELKANPKAPASGFVIEAKLDKGRGPVATVLVHRGTLKVGDAIVVGTAYGRVRAMLDPKGNNVEKAFPADPVEVLGLSSVPDAGDEFRVFEDERDARDLAEERALRRRLKEQSKSKISLDNLFDRMKEGEKTELNLIVKADVQGSIEALQDALDKMDQSEVKVNVIHSAVGGITETDVTLASASDAIIIGFGVRPQPKAKIAAEREKVDIRCYRIIYEAIDEINAARVGLLQPEEVEVDVGSAEVRSLFRVPKVGVIAGCYVTEGEMTRDGKVRVVRDGTIVMEGSIGSLRRFKDDVKSVKTGYECGIGIDGFQDIHEGDVIENYRIDKVARKE